MYTIEFKKKPEPKVITLMELLTWKSKMLEMEKQFLLNAVKAKIKEDKEYNQYNANIIQHQIAFLERLIAEASAKGEK